MNLFFSLLAGVIFGTGLLIGGMASPDKVIGFLNITRAWDPSLAFVMGGAISIGFFAFRSVKQRTRSVYGGAINIPVNRALDKRLIGGAAVFGIGWGLCGVCPAPALTGLGTGNWNMIVVLISIFIGAGLHGVWVQQFGKSE